MSIPPCSSPVPLMRAGSALPKIPTPNTRGRSSSVGQRQPKNLSVYPFIQEENTERSKRGQNHLPDAPSSSSLETANNPKNSKKRSRSLERTGRPIDINIAKLRVHGLTLLENIDRLSKGRFPLLEKYPLPSPDMTEPEIASLKLRPKDVKPDERDSLACSQQAARNMIQTVQRKSQHSGLAAFIEERKSSISSLIDVPPQTKYDPSAVGLVNFRFKEAEIAIQTPQQESSPSNQATSTRSWQGFLSSVLGRMF